MPEVIPNINDLRELPPNEDQNQSAGIRFVFKFDKSEIDFLKNNLLSKIVAEDENSTLINSTINPPRS